MSKTKSLNVRKIYIKDNPPGVFLTTGTLPYSNEKKSCFLFIGFMDYQFEDSKKIITLTHDGDLDIIKK